MATTTLTLLLLLLSLLPFAYSITAPAPFHPPTQPPTFPHSPPPRNPPIPRRPRRPSTTPPPIPPHRHRISISPVPSPSVNDDPQIDSIADAMIGSGDFGNWIDLLMRSAGATTSLPGTLTLFVPDDIALPQPHNPDPYPNQVDFDPFLYAYHVVPRRLSFADLQGFSIGSRLPTLLPGNSIVVTNNSFSNFTVNDSPITHPDLYLNGAVSVHGVGEALDYRKFGTALPPPPPPPPATLLAPPSPAPSHEREISHGYRFFPAEVTGEATRSGSNFFFVLGFSILLSLVLFCRVQLI